MASSERLFGAGGRRLGKSCGFSSSKEEAVGETPRVAAERKKITAAGGKEEFTDPFPIAYLPTTLVKYWISCLGVRTGPTTNGAKRSAFWVLHAAALNIGENEHATDFRDYSNEMGRLEFIAYIEDMGRIYENILQAAGALGVTNLVFFPFGMGAFLRNLYKLDPEYAEANLQGQRLRELRQALAKRFVRAVGETKVFVGKIHLCIAPSGRGDELDANSTAFLAEILTGVKTGLIHPKSIETLVNADALVAAQNLADDGYRVGLVNGANRRMVGNHWFSHGARMAIDENLHRRSWRMACTAYVLNGGAEAVSRQPDDLAKAVTRLGGTLIPLANSSAGGDVKGDVIKQFRRWDTSNDGRISKEEMTNVLVALGISAKDCDTIFRAADSNNDGFLSYTEFVSDSRPVEHCLLALWRTKHPHTDSTVSKVVRLLY
eukprot:s74_g20.t1